ncbi:ArsR/SmtB family transcription factor [Alkalispirochaeta sphaeroplastigenens]|uniref:ArsR/SmtB family transcription factor n=1 Tax=Alkalispirochaeta sphaeroplastigenens TaxID=1187066 RepID=UPI000CDAA9D4|nr:metalloregulator ArsR/SmtB family transcription factor [Alkalispirochaeta sphaeroplastigenens]
MDKRDLLRAEARAGVLKAMAHPTRIFIVDLIHRTGPRCVQDLSLQVGVDASTISRHLSLLKQAGILMDRKEGTTVYYSLGCDCIGEFMKGLEKVLLAKQMRDNSLLDSLLRDEGGVLSGKEMAGSQGEAPPGFDILTGARYPEKPGDT